MHKKTLYGVIIAILVTTGSSRIHRKSSPFSREIGYVNSSGQEIKELNIQIGETLHRFVHLPNRSSSTTYTGGLGVLEGEVHGLLANGTPFGPTHFKVPMRPFPVQRDIRIGPHGDIQLIGALTN